MASYWVAICSNPQRHIRTWTRRQAMRAIAVASGHQLEATGTHLVGPECTWTLPRRVEVSYVDRLALVDKCAGMRVMPWEVQNGKQ